ncbi:hypothetical protein FRC03_010832 [Tulasnella sp. 419]|nr:hypothetical protein FRC03_010832 [Tulasnella sp. 419]
MFKLERSARQRRPSSRPRFRPLVKKTFSAVKTGLKQHICFGAPNKRETFECDEEPIVLSGADGYGYFPATLGQRLDNDRFEIVRKLGWGQFSSVWLARDLSMDRFVSIKILTMNATEGVRLEALGELAISERIEKANPEHPGYHHCAHFIHHFTTSSKAGNHICFVGDVLGSTVSALRRTLPNRVLPPSMAKRILKEVLLALNYLHSECGIIHTDLKEDNMLLDFGNQEAIITQYIDSHPAESYPPRYAPSLSPDPIITIVSQPLPNFDLKEDGSNLHIRIADFGHATWIDKRYEEEDVQPVGLRAPEVILGHPWSTPIDIWAVGCLAFELLIGTAFFDPVAGKTWKLEDNHLQRMLEVTGEKFSSKMLAQSKPYYKPPQALMLLGNTPLIIRPSRGFIEQEVKKLAGMLRLDRKKAKKAQIK